MWCHTVNVKIRGRVQAQFGRGLGVGWLWVRSSAWRGRCWARWKCRWVGVVLGSQDLVARAFVYKTPARIILFGSPEPLSTKRLRESFFSSSPEPLFTKRLRESFFRDPGFHILVSRSWLPDPSFPDPGYQNIVQEVAKQLKTIVQNVASNLENKSKSCQAIRKVVQTVANNL